MTASRSRFLAIGCLWLYASLMLGACGRVGTLEQPAPLYGAKAKADYAAKKAAAAKAKAEANKDEDGAEPLAPDTPGLDQPGSATPTLRDQPVAGSHSEPTAPGPQGTLPDPFTRPQ
jgi:hypothetical protein